MTTTTAPPTTRQRRDVRTGRFEGRPRRNVEDVCRLNAATAQLVMVHPALALFAYWSSRSIDRHAARALKVERDGVGAVLMTGLDGMQRRRDLIRQPTPRGGYRVFFGCPNCSAVVAFLYLEALACRRCSRLSWSSEGRPPVSARLVGALLGDPVARAAALGRDRRLELGALRLALGPADREPPWDPAVVVADVATAVGLYDNVRLTETARG